MSDFRGNKSTIFHVEEHFLQDFFGRDELAVTHMAQLLAASPEVAGLDAYTLLAQPPRAVLDRMAALDLLETVARSDAVDVGVENVNEARQALTDLVLRPLQADLDASQRRVMAGEKYDALGALGRVAIKEGFTAYRSLPSDAQRRVLGPALMASLVELGVARSDVAEEFARYAEDS